MWSDSEFSDSNDFYATVCEPVSVCEAFPQELPNKQPGVSEQLQPQELTACSLLTFLKYSDHCVPYTHSSYKRYKDIKKFTFHHLFECVYLYYIQVHYKKMFYIVNVTIYFSFLGNYTQQNCTSFNLSYKQHCLYKHNSYIKYVHMFDVFSAHYFPQPLKSEAVL